MQKKKGIHKRGTVRLNKKPLTELKCKKEMYKMQATKEEYKDIAWACRYVIKMAKTLMDVTVERHVIGSGKDLCKYVTSKRQTMENVRLLLRNM